MKKNQPLNNKLVSLTTTLGQLDAQTQTTDKSGKVTFNITSTQTGIAQIQAKVDNKVQLKQSLTVKFE
ncbi:MAG: hypothetical protein KatS3mg092_0876 [Patescibacteria group bacterium]|nr:MAG: hypothetical protein KatS3mg092_0876 [Patescibacteria group bacterium]